MEKIDPIILGRASTLVLLSAVLSGLAISLRLVWGLVFEGGFPCAIISCAILQQSPVSSPFGVPLPWFGAGFYLGLLALSLLWLVYGGRKLYFFATGLALLGSLTHLALVAYGSIVYRSFCPWCIASAVSSLFALAALVASEPSTQRPLKGVPLALCLLAGAGASLTTTLLIDRSQSFGAVNREALLSAKASDLIPFGRTFGFAPDVHKEKRSIVAFVDFGCGTCRNVLRKARDSGVGPITSLRFPRPMTKYGTEAALLYLDANDERSRLAVVDVLLADDSRTSMTVERTRRLIGAPASPSVLALGQLKSDAELSDHLGIFGVPVLVEVSATSRRVIKSYQLKP